MRRFRTLASALLCFALGGCGINITPPQQADSGAGEAEPVAMSPQMPAASTNYGTPPSSPSPSASPGMHGAEGAMPSETDYGSSYDPAAGASPSGEAMHAAVTDGTEGAGEFPDERMHAAETPPGAGVDPGAMERERQNQFAGGARPGEPGAGPEAAGGEGGRGGSRASQFEEGSAPHVVMLMVEAIDASDVETAAKYISDDADGLLGQVRDGEAGDNQLRELQSYFATMDPLSQRPSGRSITLNFNGAQGKVLSFVVTREGREFLVESLTVRDAPARRR